MDDPLGKYWLKIMFWLLSAAEDGADAEDAAVFPTATNFGVSVLPANGFVGFMPIVESKTKTKYVPVVPVQVRNNFKFV